MILFSWVGYTLRPKLIYSDGREETIPSSNMTEILTYLADVCRKGNIHTVKTEPSTLIAWEDVLNDIFMHNYNTTERITMEAV